MKACAKLSRKAGAGGPPALLLPATEGREVVPSSQCVSRISSSKGGTKEKLAFAFAVFDTFSLQSSVPPLTPSQATTLASQVFGTGNPQSRARRTSA